MPLETYLVLGLLFVAVAIGLITWWAVRRQVRKEAELTGAREVSPEVPERPPEAAPARKDKLPGALAKTRDAWKAGFAKLVGKSPKQLGASEWDELEESLLGADVSIATSQKLLQGVRERAEGEGDLPGALKREIRAILDGVETGWTLPDAPRPFVISVVGVNGAGKTTTVGKLAWMFSQMGKKVLLGACDTFRAAATEQLRVWAERSGAQFVSGREGADPGATAFDAVSAGKSRGMDIVLLDTAGRLHTKTHLMDELKRVHKVVQKVMPDCPHQVWLVVDGTLGQNSVVQARQFQEALNVTGVVVTKLDGTAKGGSVVSIAGDLKLPVRYVGVGEAAEDLVPFQSAAFADALLSPT